MRGPAAIHPPARRAALRIPACLLVLGCLLAHMARAEPAVPGAADAAQRTALNTRVLEQFNRSCVLCHVTGEAGAPRAGDAEAWRARAAKGEAVLLQHTLEGYNDMPPLGYCQDCEIADFRALLRFMNPHAQPAD
jgi:cytochrome c5